MPARKKFFSKLSDNIVVHVTNLFNQYQQPYLLYHNLKHTEFVVSKTEQIAHHYSLREDEIFILNTAAWFHDTGQLFSYGKNHEMKSAFLMKEFLADKKIQQATINKIENCILATKMPHEPKSLLEEIICDADTFNLGTEDFLMTDYLMKKECESAERKKIDNWNEGTLNFLEHHKYFTDYCLQFLKNGKQNNINTIRARLNT